MFVRLEDGTGDVGKGGDEQQRGCVLAIAAAELAVEVFGHARTGAGDVVGDGIRELGIDALDFRAGLGVVEIDVVGVDERLLLGAAGFPEAGGDDAHQAYEGTGLLETRVFAEAGVEVAQREVEGIGDRDLAAVVN